MSNLYYDVKSLVEDRVDCQLVIKHIYEVTAFSSSVNCGRFRKWYLLTRVVTRLLRFKNKSLWSLRFQLNISEIKILDVMSMLCFYENQENSAFSCLMPSPKNCLAIFTFFLFRLITLEYRVGFLPFSFLLVEGLST